MIGLEVDEVRSLAVSVDDEGRVTNRASATGPPDTSSVSALRTLNVERGTALAIASPFPDAPYLSGVVAAIAKEFSSPIAPPGQSTAILPAGTAAAAAEAWAGAGRGVRNLVYFSVHDHATAGIVRDGVPDRGTRGRAANVAWMSLNPVDREDYRKAGGLEAEVAAHGIVRRLTWRIKSGDHSCVQDIVAGEFSAITLDHVLDAARGGDGVAVSVVRDTAKYLAMAAANLVVIADPEMVVLGGIMTTAADLLFEPVRTEMARRLPKGALDSIAVVAATLGDEAAAVGATRLAGVAVR